MLSAIRMYTICLIKCILFQIDLCHLYATKRRHDTFHITGPLWGESPSADEFLSQ